MTHFGGTERAIFAISENIRNIEFIKQGGKNTNEKSVCKTTSTKYPDSNNDILLELGLLYCFIIRILTIYFNVIYFIFTLTKGHNFGGF